MIHQIGVYRVFTSPGVEDVLCGWKWIYKHQHDLDDYNPRVSMILSGVAYDMTIKRADIIAEVCKANQV